MTRVRGGGHEVLEPLELDVEGAVGEGEGDPSLGERRRVEGGGSGDREVHAVREVRRLVEVWVEERKANIFRCTYDRIIEITIVSCNKKKTKPNRPAAYLGNRS